MSRASPETFAGTAEQARAEEIRDLQDRVARIERGAGSVAGAVTIVQTGGGSGLISSTAPTNTIEHTVSGGALTSSIPTTATPRVQQIAVGTPVADSTTAMRLATAAMTDVLVNDTVHGIYVGQPNAEGLRWRLRHGTASPFAPVDSPSPSYTMTRYMTHSDTGVDGTASHRFATLAVYNQATSASRAQPTAAYFQAVTESTQTPNYTLVNPDATAIITYAVVQPAGTGWAVGAAVYSINKSAVGGGVTGLEVAATNDMGFDGVVPGSTGSGNATTQGMGIWLHPGGVGAGTLRNVAVGLEVGKVTTARFHTGVHFIGPGGAQGNAIVDAAIRDDTATANYSYLITGAHAQAAIAVADGAGHVGVGTTTPLHPLHVLRSSPGVIARFQNTAAATTAVVVDALAGQQALLQFQEGNQPAWGIGMQATGKQFILSDDQTGFIPITITPTDGTHIYRTQLITDRLIQDQTHGVLVGEGVAGLRWNICHGFNPNSTAVDVEGPTFRINRRSHYGDPVVSGAEYERYAAFQVWHRASVGSTAQPIAGLFVGHSDSQKIEQYGAGPPGGSTVSGVTADPFNTVITVIGHELLTGNQVYIAGVTGTGNIADVNGLWTLARIDNNTFTIPVATGGAYTSGGTITVSINPDAMGLAAVGKVTGAGRGRGIGLTASGSTSSTNAVSGAMGAEVEAANSTGTDDTVVNNGIGSRTMGIWLHAGQGLNRVAAGIQFGRQGSQGFHTGIYFMGAGPQGNPAVDTSIRDDGNALTSIAINGPRSGSAVQIATGAGAIGVTATATGRSATAGLHITNAGVVSISRSTSVAQVYLQCYSSSDGTNTATRFGVQSNVDGSVRLRFGDGTGTISELYKVVGSLVLKTSHQFEVASILTVGSTLAHNGTQLGLYTKTPVNQPAALTARVNAITDNSGGTPSDTVAAAPVVYTQSWAADTIATLVAKITNLRTRVNELESKLNMSSGGIGALAGTA